MNRPASAAPALEFRVLGAIEVRVDGLALDITGFRQRRLLALLLCRGGEMVETDTLAEYVWDDADRPDNAVEAARTYISRTRRAFTDAGLDAQSILVTQSPGYRIALDNAELDSAGFERLVVEARAHLDGGDAVSAVVALDDALALWRGSAYQEFADRSWAEAEVARLAELRRVAMEQRAAARLELGAHAEVVGDLEQLVAEDPLRARPVELLMLALYRSNRQAEALRVYARYRRAVGDIGLDPPESIAALESRIAASDDELRPVLASTDTIRGYRLAEPIGEGSFSVVYRSVQPSLGREVAVKQIRAELADQPDFIRRFEAEAQTVAGLEHPHIVPLYDYWREPGSAYLVMRWLRGGTLESRLRRQRLDADESVTLATQIGSALATAHHAGVEHRDVRTANVFVDEIGNNYLGDFGIAVATKGGEANGASVDVRGLGTVLFESVTGKNGKDVGDLSLAAVRPDLPVGVEGVLLRAIVGGGGERYESVDEFVDDYVTAINGSRAGRSRDSHPIPLLEDISNPYKGLRAFQESDADDFRGRDRLVDRLLWQMASGGTEGRFVAAVGPSGSGKSSLVRAGLLPRVRAGAIDGSDQWFVTTMLPGVRPFDALEAALSRVATAATAGLAEVMRADPNGISRAVDSVLPDETSELLVVIDQFEELFALVGDDEARRAFLDGLVAAVSDPRSRLRIVVTIRADHWHRPLQHPDVARILETSAVTVTPMAADELERAITDPARRMGVTFEPGLVSDIVAEVHDQPGALPLMQYLLTELFDARQAGLMGIETYRQLGGVAGGLARRADGLFDECTESEQDGVRRLFSRLITPGEGVEDTRRRARLSELTMVSDAVIERFGGGRMLSFDHDPETREPTIEVAHEALIREWPRLREWVDNDRDGLRITRRLTLAAAEWDATSRPESELYRGGRLETAEAWAGDHSNDLNESEREFLTASTERQQQEAADERNRVRRLRGLLAATAAIAVIALVAGAIAWSQQRRADDAAQDAARERDAAEESGQLEAEARRSAEAAREGEEEARVEAENATNVAVAAQTAESQARASAEFRRVVVESGSFRESEPTLSLLLALEAQDRGPGPESVGALLTSLQRTDGYLGHISTATASSNDQWIGALGDERLVVRSPTSIDLFDLELRELVWSEPSLAPSRELRGTSARTLATGSVAAGRFATVDNSGDISLIGPESDRLIVFPATDGRRASAVAVGPNGTLLVGHDDGRVELWAGVDLADRRPVGLHPTTVVYAALSADGRLAATQDLNGSLTLWDVDLGTPRWTWTVGATDRHDPDAGVLTFVNVVDEVPAFVRLIQGGPPEVDVNFLLGFGPIGEIHFSSDDTSLYFKGTGVVAIDAATGYKMWEGPPTGVSTQFEEFSTGTVINGNTLIRDGETETLAGIPEGARTTITPDGDMVASLSSEGLTLWSMTGDLLIATAVQRDGDNHATVSGDGRRLASLNYEEFTTGRGDRRLTDVASGTELWTLEEPANWLTYTGDDHFSEWGHTSEGLGIIPRNPVAFGPAGVLSRTDGFGTFEFSPNGQLLAIGDIQFPNVRIHDAATGVLVETLTVPGETSDGTYFLDFSPDGRLLAASNNTGVGVWNTTTWEIEHQIDSFAGDAPREVAFSPDGNEVAIGVGSGGVLVFDLATANLRTLATGSSEPAGIYDLNGLEYTTDGKYLVAAGFDASLIDVESGMVLGQRFPSSELRFGTSVSDGATALVTGTEDHLLVWSLSLEDWPAIACLAAGRNMTLEEWEQFGWTGEPYHATCPQWPDASEEAAG